MADLDFPTSPSDGDTYAGYVYNAAKGVWQWQTLSPSLVSLTDTDISAPSSGEVLEYDGTNWVNAAAAAGGKILQVVQSVSSTGVSIASTTYTDTDLSATITPSSASSKILVMISQHLIIDRDSSSAGSGLQLLRDGSVVENFDKGTKRDTFYIEALGSTGIFARSFFNAQYLDSPATTSAVVYKTQAAVNNTSNGGRVVTDSVPGYMTLIEVAA